MMRLDRARLLASAVVLVAGGGTLLLTLSATAQARPQYREQAIRQLRLPGSPLYLSTMSCTYCHVRHYGGANWNAFGEALRAGFREQPRLDFAGVLHAQLSRNLDVDGDGYEDALEVFARTLPGDAGSVPPVPRTALLAQFRAAGGADQYRPPPRR